MKIDMAALRRDMEKQLADSPQEEKGLKEAISEYSGADLHDPDTLLSLARAVGADLSSYKAGPDATDVFDTADDEDSEIGDLADDVDDLSGDYY